MRENDVLNQNVSIATDSSNANTNNTTQQNVPAELNSASSQGMMYLDIIQPFAL